MMRAVIRFGRARPWQALLGSGGRAEQLAQAGLLGLALTASAWLLWYEHTLQSRIAASMAQLESSTKVPPKPAAPRPEPQRSADYLRQLDATTARLNTPWAAVLDLVERTSTPQVALLSLEPDARSGFVTLTAEARKLPDLLLYAEALASDSSVSDVRLGQHELRADEPGQPVRMTMTVVPTPLRP